MFYPMYQKPVSVQKSLSVISVESTAFDVLASEGRIASERLTSQMLYPNMPLIVICEENGQKHSLLAIALKEEDKEKRTITVHKVSHGKDGGSVNGIKPRNKEQSLLLALLQMMHVRVLVVTGPAGTGKSLCIAAHAFEVISKTKDMKLVLTKPLEIVTGTRFWGTMPGNADEKFEPFLKSFSVLFESISPRGASTREYVDGLLKSKRIEFYPLEVMRGVSHRNSYVWYDEAQNMDCHEMLTLGSRIDDVGQSRLVLSGDLYQQDRHIARPETGLHHLVTSKHFLESPHTAHMDLNKIERGVVCQLFHDIFSGLA
jgi:PhoH-like ATPase